MNFSQALERIKWGQPMSRAAWSDPSIYVYRPNPPNENTMMLRVHSSESVWSPSSVDVMADDWFDVPRTN